MVIAVLLQATPACPPPPPPPGCVLTQHVDSARMHIYVGARPVEQLFLFVVFTSNLPLACLSSTFSSSLRELT
jgi:hypothetical protein